MNDYVKGCLSYDPSVYDKRGNRIDAVQLINEMSERIAELEANQAKRDLEQQAKGISDLDNMLSILGEVLSSRVMQERVKELRKQAEEL